MYSSAQLRQAVRAAARSSSTEFAALALLLSCLAAAEDLADLRNLGFVTVGIVASAGVISALLLSLDGTVMTTAPVDEHGQVLNLPGTDGVPGRVTHLQILQVVVGKQSLGTLTA